MVDLTRGGTLVISFYFTTPIVLIRGIVGWRVVGGGFGVGLGGRL